SNLSPLFHGGRRAFCGRGSSLVRSTPPVAPFANGTNLWSSARVSRPWTRRGRQQHSAAVGVFEAVEGAEAQLLSQSPITHAGRLRPSIRLVGGGEQICEEMQQ